MKCRMFNVRLTDAQFTDLKLISEQQNKTKSRIARKAIINLIRTNKKGFV